MNEKTNDCPAVDVNDFITRGLNFLLTVGISQTTYITLDHNLPNIFG
jgi:hypothetical protein